ncbi:kinase-like protein [Gigaspora margarita]|uniref:Kinase-like protein n=1 Tax=Gigaspora margarita TaxID=4874 RepID=A0A8H4AMC4_GIGMA|nr:kinase-like protein [Gigaspora margarita]
MIVKRVQNVKNKKKSQCKNCDINEEYINTLSESQNVKPIYIEKARFGKEQHMKLYSNCVYCPRCLTKIELKKKSTSEDSMEKMSLRFLVNDDPTSSSLKETMSLNFPNVMISTSFYLKILTEWLDNQISERLITRYDYNEFNILQKVGEGAYAEVYKAEWKNSSTVRIVALKFMKCVKSPETLHEHILNILVHKGKMKIADFGLSTYGANLNSTNYEVAGIPTFFDPQALKDSKYVLTKKSDNYGLGVILWVISSCRMPFENIPKQEIIFQILQGKREKSIENTPLEYINLYKRCWQDDPESRPNSNNILEDLERIISIEEL